MGKAKKFPQCFKVLPKGMTPPAENGETWASYPFDESMNLFINTAHDEVIKWLAQILNREKKAMDFAQTFAKRNALKHLSGLQRSPGAQWQLQVLAWRPTGNNVVKWDATQYANLQDRVAGMIEGNRDEFSGDKPPQLEVKTGSERASDEDGFDTLEATTDPEDHPEIMQEAQGATDEPAPKEITPQTKPEPQIPVELSKETKQAVTLSKQFPSDFKQAFLDCGFGDRPVESLKREEAVRVVKVLNQILDSQADG